MLSRHSLGLFATMGVLIANLSHAQVAEQAPGLPVPPMEAPTSGMIVFDDEFNVLEPSKYSTAYAWGARWLDDGEQQAYVDPYYTGGSTSYLGLNPFSISNGMLQIQAAIPPATVVPYLQGQKYTSGILTTYNSFTQLYGYFEIRAKLPAGKGFWPAFWLLPKVLLPKPPEIDVVEVLGDQLTNLFVTAHWNEGAEAKKKSYKIVVPDLSADFHRYGALWNSTHIAWYFDGRRVAYTTTPTDLRSPMYLLLNLAVGGKWPGIPNGATRFPGNMLVSYIRVYSVD
jgi:serralysin